MDMLPSSPYPEGHWFVLKTKSSISSSSTRAKLSAITGWKTKMWLTDCTAAETKKHFKHKKRLQQHYGWLNAFYCHFRTTTSTILVPTLSQAVTNRCPNLCQQRNSMQLVLN